MTGGNWGDPNTDVVADFAAAANQMRAAWDRQAPDYAAAQFAVWAEDGTDYLRRALDCLEVLWPRLGLDDTSTGTVLDLGCGVGRLAFPIQAALPRCQVVGVDVSPRMIELAEGLAYGPTPTPEFVVGDGVTIPPVDALAGAYSMLVFQHVPPSVAAGYVRQVAARLAPGARFIFQYVEGDEHEAMSQHATEADVIAWCVTAGLDVLNIEHGLLYPNWGWVTTTRPTW